jgi:spermidine synthase
MQTAKRVLLVLPMLSGASGLALEVLWLREASLVFGSTAQAAGATLGVFFLGLAVGSAWWAPRAARSERPLRLYGMLELGTAAGALVTLGALEWLRYAPLPSGAAVGEGARLMARLAVATVLLLPPTVCMGGTLPALFEATTGARADASRSLRLAYALNTLGAAAGAVIAGFVLPQAVGYRQTYLLAVAVATVVGMIAVVLGRRPYLRRRHAAGTSATMDPTDAAPARLPVLAVGLALLSGFGVLAMEVLWTRLLMLVTNNSTYVFAMILATVLISLSLGAWIVAWSGVRAVGASRWLAWTLALAGAASALTSVALVYATRDLSTLAVGQGWGAYLWSIGTASALLMLVPGVLLGMVLPLVLSYYTRATRAAVRWTGPLLATNALGAVAGALAAGFLLLPLLHYWVSLATVALAYGVAAVLVRLAEPRRDGAGSFAALAVLSALAIGALLPRGPTVRLGAGERLLGFAEGSGGSVAVTEGGGNRVMRLNNGYVLGDTRSAEVERLQARLPLLLHPQPRSVFLLGMGTGLTAGAALEMGVTRVTVSELLPEVVRAARDFFAPWSGALYSDPRVRLVVEDGRHLLAAERTRYDVIIADLFVPWQAGAGALYTREHFRTVRSRLAHNGLFVQWLPLYQLSREEFLIIVQTLRAAFPQVSLWRGNFSASEPIVALIAQPSVGPLDFGAIRQNAHRFRESGTAYAGGGDVMAGLFYLGNTLGLDTSAVRVPVNTDDRPVIEHLAPRLRAEGRSPLVGHDLLQFVDRLARGTPPLADPVLQQFPAHERVFVEAGRQLHRFYVFARTGMDDSARVARSRADALLPRGMRSAATVGTAR